MSSFTITTAVNGSSLTRLGQVAGLAWTRSTTTATVTQNNHGMVTGDLFNVTTTSDAAAITTGVKTISYLSANTFTFTCLNAGAASGTVTANHIDDYLLNGGYLTIDTHTRYGLGSNLYAAMGDIVGSASLGGSIEFNSTLIRLIPFDGVSAGNVPALDTTITGGTSGASGKILGVYSALTAAPTAAGAACPGTGYLLVRQWNSIAFQDNETLSALATGALVNGTDRAGWLEIVGCESLTATINRLNLFKVRGDYWDFLGVTTDGTRATTYQIPTNGGSQIHVPAVFVQSAAVSITGASWSAGTATYIYSGHLFQKGQELTVTGASASGYNVTDAVITAVTQSTFSVAIVSDPGTWTSGGSATTYEAYPNAGSRTALIANIQTDWLRGRWCWVSTGGLVRFGHDGTNSTGGYIPPSGRKIRVPNIFFTVCTQIAPTANVLPNATLGTRYEFATTGGGAIDIDKASMNWYCNFAQSYSVALTNISTFEALILTECASQIAWKQVVVGQSNTANTQTALTMGLNFSGGYMDSCCWTRIAQASSGTYVTSWADCSYFSVNGERVHSLTKAANAASGGKTMTRVVQSAWNRPITGAGRDLVVGCDTVEWNNPTYYDNINGTTGTSIPMYAFDLGTAASYRLKVDGLSFGGLTHVQPYSGVLNIGVAGCFDIKLRNLGTAAAPLDMGGAIAYGTWTRSTTTMTVTKTAHGLKANDIIAVIACSDVAPKALTTTTATLWTVASAPTADTFTVTVSNAGQTTGQNLTYYPCMTGNLVNTVAGGAANTVKIQRCYTPNLRTGILTTFDNSVKNVLLEDVWGTEWGVQLVPMLNCEMHRVQSTLALTAQTSCYGTHFADYYTAPNPANQAAVSWTRSTTTCTVTSSAHGLRVGNQVVVTVSSDTAAVILGVKTLTQIAAVASPVNTQNTFQFTCLNAGAASGTLTFVPLNGRVAFEMNEATNETSSQVALSNGAAFTSAGGLYMPTVNQQADFTLPVNLIGHSSFPIAEAVMAGGTIGNYDITYSVDGGVTYKNLYYPRPGGGGSNASTTVTMTSTTGVASGDYVWGTNIGYNAKVVTVDSGTNITVDKANIGTVSGVLRFNQLPSETISDPTIGIPLKVRIKTTTTNATAITSLYFFTTSDSTARAATSTLDNIVLTLTGIITGSDVVVNSYNTNTTIGEADEIIGTTYAGTFAGGQSVTIKIMKSGYKPWVLYNYSLGSSNVTLPIAQVVDRDYV